MKFAALITFTIFSFLSHGETIRPSEYKILKKVSVTSVKVSFTDLSCCDFSLDGRVDIKIDGNDSFVLVGGEVETCAKFELGELDYDCRPFPSLVLKEALNKSILSGEEISLIIDEAPCSGSSEVPKSKCMGFLQGAIIKDDVYLLEDVDLTYKK
ncbi:MAG: hypothetical protein HOE90_03160 [Bacteriovoracaceae bacterium]|jgi:hypothetical protein|nr:hypothetical protein [Bacteriovoracaceae bacterium]